MFYGNWGKSKKHFTPPPPPQNKQSPQFFSKEKGNKKLCFFKGVHGSGTKRSQKNVLNVWNQFKLLSLQKNKMGTVQWKKSRKWNVIKD